MDDRGQDNCGEQRGHDHEQLPRVQTSAYQLQTQKRQLTTHHVGSDCILNNCCDHVVKVAMTV